MPHALDNRPVHHLDTPAARLCAVCDTCPPPPRPLFRPHVAINAVRASDLANPWTVVGHHELQARPGASLALWGARPGLIGTAQTLTCRPRPACASLVALAASHCVSSIHRLQEDRGAGAQDPQKPRSVRSGVQGAGRPRFCLPGAVCAAVAGSCAAEWLPAGLSGCPVGVDEPYVDQMFDCCKLLKIPAEIEVRVSATYSSGRACPNTASACVSACRTPPQHTT